VSGECNAASNLEGRVVLAHPTRAAHADQIAAREQIERVVLNAYAPTTHVYILDLDELAKLPEGGFFRV